MPSGISGNARPPTWGGADEDTGSTAGRASPGRLGSLAASPAEGQPASALSAGALRLLLAIRPGSRLEIGILVPDESDLPR